MSKKCCRFFGGLLKTQENWLNRMSQQGWHLVGTGKLMYEFEPCQPGQYQYKVEYIAPYSKHSAQSYARLLEDYGYRVFYKNMNLNWSVGKVQARPWAEKGGRLATNATTFGRELLLVEKEADGTPFELHTTLEDQQRYFQHMCRPWLFLLLLCAVLFVAVRKTVCLVFGIISLLMVLLFQWEIAKVKKDGSPNA